MGQFKYRGPSELRTHLLKNSTYPFGAVSDARPQLSFDELTALVDWICERPQIAAKVFPPLLQSYQSLHDFPEMRPVALPKEIVWVATFLRHQAKYIRRFLELSSRYESSVLLDDHDGASRSLDLVEAECGVSLWLIKQRIYLLQESQGLDAQKKYAEGVWKPGPGSNLQRLIAFAISSRNEPAVSPTGFKEWFDDFMAHIDWPSHVHDYVSFHVEPTAMLGEDQVGDVLRLDISGALVDCYESLVSQTAHLFVNGTDTTNSAVASAVLPLLVVTEDRRLRGLLDLVLPESITAADDTLYPLISEYLSGRYEQVIQRAERELADDPLRSELFVLAARAATRAPAFSRGRGAGTSSKVIAAISRLLAHGDSGGEDYLELRKMATNLFGTKLSYVLMSVLDDCSRPAARAPVECGSHISALTMEHGPAMWLDVFQDAEERMHVASMLEKRAPGSVVAQLAGALVNAELNRTGIVGGLIR